MNRKRIALVSSYKIYCGIAYAAEQLEKELGRYYDIDALPIDHDFTHLMAPKSTYRAINNYFKDIAEKVRAYDYVNIQMEPGLFGRTPIFMWQRICTVLNGIRGHAIVTVHHAMLPDQLNLRSLHSSYHQHGMLGPFILLLRSYRCRRFWRIVRRMMQEKRLTMLFLNKPEKERFQHTQKLTRVADHPLCFLLKEERDYNRDTHKPDYRQLFRLGPAEVMLGVFGMITPTKGMVDAIRAMVYLPDHFRLVIFGGANIRVLQQHQECDAYLNTMIQLVKALKLEQRVIFNGTLTNEEMPQAMAQASIVIFPYPETRQMASGPGTLAIELAPKIIASDTFAFNCYNDTYPDRMHLYTSGNYLQLAQMIMELQKKPVVDVPYLAPNAETQARIYHDIWEGLIDPERS